jgi:hypothetical protein
MTKYDKIWIPVTNDDTVPVEGKAISGIYYKPVKNQIVLTIEELREVWEAGRAYEQDERMNNFFNRPDFSKFLTSKGIVL